MESMDEEAIQARIQAYFNDELLQNIKSGRNAEVLSALEGLDLCQIRNKHKATLLHIAAEYNNKGLTIHLINLGTDVNAQDNIRRTPLMLAIKCEHEEIVEILLKAKADLCLPNLLGNCALGIAVDDVEQISENIRKSVLNYTTSKSLIRSPYFATPSFHEDCPLYHYELAKNHELARTLLQMGSPVNAQHLISGTTAMHEAVDFLDLDLINLLLEYDSHLNLGNSYGDRPLALIDSSSTDEKTLNIVKTLINAGARLIENDSRERLMYSLLARGSRQIVRAILECNVDLFEKNSSRRPKRPIDYLLKNKDPGIVEELINFNIHVGASINDNTTLLHSAAQNGHIGLLKLLLRRGTDINVRNSENLMPLHVAIVNFAEYVTRVRSLPRNEVETKEKAEERLIRRVRCIEILLENGADPQIFTPDINYQMYIEYVDGNLQVNIQLLTPVLAHLALHRGSGGEVNEFMLQEILKRPWLQQILEMHTMEVERMKRNAPINNEVTMFDFLVTKNVSVYAEDDDIVANLTAMMQYYNDDSYYNRRIREQFSKLTRLVAVNKIFVEYFNTSVINIAEKIVNYM